MSILWAFFFLQRLNKEIDFGRHFINRKFSHGSYLITLMWKSKSYLWVVIALFVSEAGLCVCRTYFCSLRSKYFFNVKKSSCVFVELSLVETKRAKTTNTVFVNEKHGLWTLVEIGVLILKHFNTNLNVSVQRFFFCYNVGSVLISIGFSAV